MVGSTWEGLERHNKASALAQALRPAVAVFVLDGCRPDYLTRTKTRTISLMAEEGVVVHDCRTVFPSLTSPSHTTLVTGLYPRKHGIATGFRLSCDGRHTEEIPMMSYNGRSIAELAKPSGFITGSVEEFALFTRGADLYVHVPSHGVDEVLKFTRLAIDAKRPRLLYVVFFAVDDAGHLSGPRSNKVDRVIKEIDDALAQIIGAFEKVNQTAKPMYVLTSDHGMTSISHDISGELDAAVDRVREGIPTRFLGRIAQVFPRDESEKMEVVRSISGVRGVDAILEADELRALNSAGEHEPWVIASLSSGYSCFQGEARRMRGHHGGLEEEETRVPLLLYAPGGRPERLPFAETVNVAPTVAANIGLPAVDFDGGPLVRSSKSTRRSGDELKRHLTGAERSYRKCVELVRTSSRLKKEWASGALSDREFSTESRSAARALREASLRRA